MLGIGGRHANAVEGIELSRRIGGSLNVADADSRYDSFGLLQGIGDNICGLYFASGIDGNDTNLEGKRHHTLSHDVVGGVDGGNGVAAECAVIHSHGVGGIVVDAIALRLCTFGESPADGNHIGEDFLLFSIIVGDGYHLAIDVACHLHIADTHLGVVENIYGIGDGGITVVDDIERIDAIEEDSSGVGVASDLNPFAVADDGVGGALPCDGHGVALVGDGVDGCGGVVAVNLCIGVAGDRDGVILSIEMCLCDAIVVVIVSISDVACQFSTRERGCLDKEVTGVLVGSSAHVSAHESDRGLYEIITIVFIVVGDGHGERTWCSRCDVAVSVVSVGIGAQ